MADSPSFAGRIPVHVALALLASLRDVDTPSDPEALSESEMPLNLKRRLGLSTVIVDQIRRYEKRKGGTVSAEEVASLFELIARRADAGAIFREAGHRIARVDLDKRRFPARIALRLLPHALRRRRAWRRVRRIARDLSPRSTIRIERKPGALVIEGSLPARAAPGGVGCAVVEGVIARVFDAYREGNVEISHRCEGESGARCAWELSGDAARIAEAGGSDESTRAQEPAEASETDVSETETPQPESVVGG